MYPRVYIQVSRLVSERMQTVLPVHVAQTTRLWRERRTASFVILDEGRTSMCWDSKGQTGVWYEDLPQQDLGSTCQAWLAEEK